MIKIENLTKNFKNGGGIYDISFSFNEGDIIALVGPNGAGKTTLIKSIMQEYKLNQGSILFDSQKINSVNIKQIAFFPDSNNIPLDIKVKDYIYYFYICAGLFKKDFKNNLSKLVSWLGIDQFLNKKIKQLSAGQKKKVILASVLIRKPKYIIFDEPTANMDIENKIEFMSIINSLKNVGISILITSHIIEELQKIANKLILIKEGRIVYDNKFDSNNEKIIDVYSKYFNLSNNEMEIMRLYS
ncbi:ATP-binding cassette domain-containing protein [Spiroplasma diminutum]|uniref:ABC transporter ATP-binding protein n=1 Tax=Spiroplasma diminutum CUAS-1 TaxID=1276221 RepID=S5LYZ3_9MOLU|nr:ABC transporter ATP-binding protein [Spiroplasma diminutum]AGR41766.1 ABC transporter ATP-binding protein [Spiroplasma diminutum CUAS-1]